VACLSDLLGRPLRTFQASQAATKALSQLILLEAGDEIRTHDPYLGKVMLYRLSYAAIRWGMAASSPACRKSAVNLKSSRSASGFFASLETHQRDPADHRP
jgi:hypothetical protein